MRGKLTCACGKCTINSSDREFGNEIMEEHMRECFALQELSGVKG